MTTMEGRSLWATTHRERRVRCVAHTVDRGRLDPHLPAFAAIVALGLVLALLATADLLMVVGVIV